MRRTLLLAISAAIASVIAPQSSHAQGGITVCDNINSPYYQGQLFPRFADVNNRLVLADLTTGENVRTLAETLSYTYSFRWSPDCHYLIGYSVGYNQCDPGLIIWDAITGQQQLSEKGFCDSLRGSYPHVHWKPDHSAVLLSEWARGWNSESSARTRIIWYPATGQRVQLQITGIEPNLFQVYWDDARGWLWGSSHYGVTAFDTRTGKQVVSFENTTNTSNPFFFTSSHFTFSPDSSKVILNGQHNFNNHMFPAMTVYDIASGIPTQVNVEENGTGAVALSPDNRYLVMAFDAIRVWDMTNLPDNLEDRLPAYRHHGPGTRMFEVRFVDNTIVEVTSYRGQTSRWDVVSGQPVE